MDGWRHEVTNIHVYGSSPQHVSLKQCSLVFQITEEKSSNTSQHLPWWAYLRVKFLTGVNGTNDMDTGLHSFKAFPANQNKHTVDVRNDKYLFWFSCLRFNSKSETDSTMYRRKKATFKHLSQVPWTVILFSPFPNCTEMPLALFSMLLLLFHLKQKTFFTVY